MANVAIVLENGFEETEAVVPFDVLRRCHIGVRFVSTHSASVTSAQGLIILTDMVDSLDNFDAIILPGGMPGAANLATNQTVISAVQSFTTANKPVGAICASPALVLSKAGVLNGRRFTCYPGMQSHVSGGEYTEENVTVDGNIITSAGPATALQFGLMVARKLGVDPDDVAESLLWTRYND